MAVSLFLRKNGKPIVLNSYQKDIADAILSREKKVLIWAATRAGKSFTVALATLLTALIYPGLKVRIIAPTDAHARIIMDYIIEHLTDHPLIIGQLPLGMDSQERIKKQLSKSRITFRNGSEIRVLSATLSMQGRGVVGFGGDLIIVDEAEQIPADIIKEKIMRMLGDNPDSSIILIGNPVMKGFMYEKSFDPSWKKIHVGWEDCVKEKRFAMAFVEERRKELSPEQFMIWYEAMYPEDYEDSLIRSSWVKRALERKVEGEGVRWAGLDVAEAGQDYSVCSVVEHSENGFRLVSVDSWHKSDTMQTASRALKLVEEHGVKEIRVDAIGVGKGVADRLKEMVRERQVECRIKEVKVSSSPLRDKERFLNLKAEMAWNVRSIFEEGRISLFEHAQLLKELNLMRYEITSTGKVKIVDPPDKSPDFFDSLSLALMPKVGGGFFVLER